MMPKTKERVPVFNVGDRFVNTIGRHGVVLKKWKGYYPYSARMDDFYEVRWADNDAEETLHRMQYFCKHVKEAK